MVRLKGGDPGIFGRLGEEMDHLAAHGIPTIKEATDLYCKLTGRDGVPDLDWYSAYNMFRLTAILQGIAGRVRDGTAASEQAKESIKRIPALSDTALKFAIKAGL